MKTKNAILGLILTITIIIIAFVGFVIKQDNLSTKKERLDFFTEYIDIQFNVIYDSYLYSSNILYYALSNDPKIIELLTDFQLSTTNQLQLNERVNEHLVNVLKTYHSNDISELSFSVNSNKVQAKEEHLLTDDQQVKKSDTLNNKPYFNLASTGNLIQFFFKYPMILPNGNSIGTLKIGYNFNSINNRILKINPKSNLGLILIPDTSTNYKKDLLMPGFITIHKESKVLTTNDSAYSEILSESGTNTIIISAINEMLKDSLHYKRSIYLNTNKKLNVITFRKIETLNKTGNIFLFSIHHDQFLEKTRQLNNAIFFINLIIVSLGMLGIIYLFLNRINILKQKQNIQKSEQKLMKLNESKDKFFSIIAHDLKNPFNGIMGMSSYLSMEFDTIDDKEKKEIIDDINISSKNAYNLLQNLLEWTRTQSGTIKNNPEIIETVNIIELSLETVSNLAKNKHIEIIKTISTEEKGWADENLVSTVLRNLTTNAIKFSPRDSVIEILVKDYDDELVFCVLDNGIGLHDEEIDQIFRIDVNFHKLGTEKEVGSGLGLKICKEFVEYCKGRIWVVSEIGKGSSFYFTIPIYKGQTTTLKH